MSNSDPYSWGAVGGNAAPGLGGTAGDNGAFNTSFEASPSFDNKAIQAGQVNQFVGQGQGDAGQQQTALNQLNNMAQGKGPSAATSLLQSETAQTQAATDALASSGSGQAGQGAARRQAMMQSGQALQNLGGQAATARAQEQMGAISQEGNLASNMRGQDLGTAQMYGNLATNQANIMQGYSAQGQQQSQFNTNTAMSLGTSAAGAVAGGLLAFADGDIGGARVGTSDFKEPGGASHWTIREEPNYILAVNQRTGQMYKLATQPLTEQEKRQATAPHGAGPLGADDPRRQHAQMADGDLGGDARFAEIVRRAHSGLYRAAQAQSPSQRYADADLDNEIQRSVYSGRDSGGNEYAVPGYTPPTVSSSRYNDDEAGHQLSEQALQGQLDKLRYGTGPQSKEQADAQAMAASGLSAPADSGKNWSRVVGGALAGFANPKGVQSLAMKKQAPKTSAPSTAAPPSVQAPTAPAPEAPIAYPQDYAQAYPERQLSDGDLSGNDLSAAIDKAYQAANDRIRGARASAQADASLRELAQMRKDALRDIEFTPEEERPLLKRKPSSMTGSVALSPTAPDGRFLEGLGYGSDGRVALDDADRGGRVDVGPIESKPGEYPDGDLGDDDEENGIETHTAREAFDDDIARERAVLESQRAPVDLDAYVPSVDDRYGWEDPEVERYASEDRAGRPSSYPQTAAEERKHRKLTNEIASMNPYGEPARQKRPALAVLFPEAKKPAAKVGPTDWLSAVRQGREVEGRSEAGAKGLRKYGLDLVPGEAEEIAAKGGNLEEARRRTKSRQSVRDLIAQWDEEKKERRKYGDGDLLGGASDPAKKTTRQLTRTGNERKGQLQQQLRDLEDEEVSRDQIDAQNRRYQDADLVGTKRSALASMFKAKPKKRKAA